MNDKSEIDRFGLSERVGGCHLNERRDPFAELVQRLLENEVQEHTVDLCLWAQDHLAGVTRS